jgi:hypothetical protein
MENWEDRLLDWARENGVESQFGVESQSGVESRSGVLTLLLLSGVDNPRFERLRKLEKLHLSHKNLKKLPPEIGNLQNLQTLDLLDNNLKELPPEIGNLLDWDFDKKTHKFIKEESESTKDFFIRAGYKIASPKPVAKPEPVSPEPLKVSELLQKFPDSFSPLSNLKRGISFIDSLLSEIEKSKEFYKSEISTSKESFKKISRLDSQHYELIKIRDLIAENSFFSFDDLVQKLEKFKVEAENEISEILEISSLQDFNRKSFDFYLFVETVVELYNSKLQKLENFSKLSEALSEITKNMEDIFEADEVFQSVKIPKLQKNLRDEYLDESEIDGIISEWVEKAQKFHDEVFQLLKLHFSEKSYFPKIFPELQKYRKSLDHFYENEKVKIIQNWHSNPKRELLTKVESSGELLKLWNSFEENLLELEERESLKLFQNRNSEIFTFAIQTEVSENIKSGFQKLEEKILKSVISDIVEYGKELKERNREINSLLFRMQKELEAQQ